MILFKCYCRNPYSESVKGCLMRVRHFCFPSPCCTISWVVSMWKWFQQQTENLQTALKLSEICRGFVIQEWWLWVMTSISCITHKKDPPFLQLQLCFPTDTNVTQSCLTQGWSQVRIHEWQLHKVQNRRWRLP